jgi:hypothetical protein
MGKWQPIQTAPKDGRPVLLSFRDEDDEWCVIQGWYESEIADRQWYDIYHGPVEPIHWMPLPDAPTDPV